MYYFYVGWFKLVGYLINIFSKNKRVIYNLVINIFLNFVLFEKKKNGRSFINEKKYIVLIFIIYIDVLGRKWRGE